MCTVLLYIFVEGDPYGLVTCRFLSMEMLTDRPVSHQDEITKKSSTYRPDISDKKYSKVDCSNFHNIHLKWIRSYCWPIHNHKRERHNIMMI